jgi:membrane carboxypeptidase/penicillin-binding protein PbpC
LPESRQVLDARIAWLLTDILADGAARAPAFGANSVLEIGRPAAVKTGTTTDFRDNWTVGYTPQMAVGVWVGNADGSPMHRISGVSGAGPVWNDVMRAVHRDLPVVGFTQPAGMVRVGVCALSGMLSSAACPHVRYEWFVAGTEPTAPDTWHRYENGRLVIDVPSAAREWARVQGWPLVGESSDTSAVLVELMQPYDGTLVRIDRALPRQVQQLPIEVRVRVNDAASVEVVDARGAIVARLPPNGGRSFWKLTPGEHEFRARVRRADGSVVQSAAARVTVLDSP